MDSSNYGIFFGATCQKPSRTKFGKVSPIISPVILILAVVLYNIEIKKVAKQIGIKRQRIEYELPRLVFTIEKTLKHSRDVLYMLDSYRESAGPELAHELAITVADMKSGNYEESIRICK